MLKIKSIILFLLFISTFIVSPASANYKISQEYVAVYCSPEFAWVWKNKYHPDLLWVSHGFDDFDDFCRETRRRAGERPIVLDLDVHGNDDGLYAYPEVNGSFKTSHTTMGYIVNQLVYFLGDKHPVVLLEACYAGNAYQNTIRNNSRDELNYNPLPPFPIYGTGSGSVNWGTTVFIQYKYNLRLYFEDLRLYEQIPAKQHEEENIRIDDDTFPISSTCYNLKSLFDYYFYNIP